MRPGELNIVVEAMHIVTDKLPAYFVTHICYGEFKSIYPDMLEIPVDNFDLEMANSNLDMLKLIKEHPFTKHISFGVVDVHSLEIENVDTVKDRIQSALQLLPKEALWVDPDCGLKTRTVDEAIEKMNVVVEASKRFRNY